MDSGVGIRDAVLDCASFPDHSRTGVSRIGATQTKTIIDDFRARKAGLATAAAGTGSADGSAY